MSGFLGKEPESYVGYGYAAAIREGAGENPVIFLGLFPTHSCGRSEYGNAAAEHQIWFVAFLGTKY